MDDVIEDLGHVPGGRAGSVWFGHRWISRTETAPGALVRDLRDKGVVQEGSRPAHTTVHLHKPNSRYGVLGCGPRHLDPPQAHQPMVVDARMHLVRREGTVSPSAPAIAPEQVVDVSSRFSAAYHAQHHLAPPTRPVLDLGVFQTLARLLAGPALLPLHELWKWLGEREARGGWVACRWPTLR